MAGAKQGPAFVVDLVKRSRPPGADSASIAGVQRAVHKMARHHSLAADPATAVTLIEAVPSADPALAVAMLDGIAQGWPEERPPQLTDAQRNSLKSAARGAPGPVAEAFGRVATRWTLPDVFRSQ